MCVCQTDWNAPICADCKTVRTRHPALNQMMRKVQMGTLKNWLMNMIFKVILDITYDLSSWTLHVTCFFGHYMTCSLGHYVWLVILDIIYDLSSWTLFRTRHLGHYMWLVILDILYDLSSWTLYMTCHIGHYFGLVILDRLVILDIVYILSSCTYDLQSMQIIWHVCKTIKDPSLIHKNICLLAKHIGPRYCVTTLFFLITWNKVNLVLEHAISFLCLILRNAPPIITGQYHYIGQTPQTRQKLALFVVWGWGNNVIYNDLNIQHIYFSFRFLGFAIKLLQTRVT